MCIRDSSELGHAKCSFTIKVKDFEFGDRFDLGDSYIKSANLNGKKEVGGIEYFNNFLVKTFDAVSYTHLVCADCGKRLFKYADYIADLID